MGEIVELQDTKNHIYTIVNSAKATEENHCSNLPFAFSNTQGTEMVSLFLDIREGLKVDVIPEGGGGAFSSKLLKMVDTRFVKIIISSEEYSLKRNVKYGKQFLTPLASLINIVARLF